MVDSGQPRTTGVFIPSGSRVVLVVSRGPASFASGPTVPVPPLVGTTQGNALSALQDLGLNALVFNDYSETVPRGRIMSQLPGESRGVPEGTDVALIVSAGGSPVQRADVALPDVVGMREADGLAALQAAALSPQINYQHHPTVPEGYIADQVPNAQSVLVHIETRRSPLWIWGMAGLALLAVVLLGLLFFGQRAANPGTIPDVTGLTQTEAVSVLQSAGFKMGSVEASESAEVAQGVVVAQFPAAGAQAAEGTSVDLVVSGGPVQVEVPEVVGTSEGEATAELQGLGLEVVVTRNPSAVDKGEVIRQLPAAGSRVALGSEVELIVSDGAGTQSSTVPDVTGMTEADARAALADAGLQVFRAENPSDDVAAGQVVAQAPAPGESISEGGTVAIIVSTGPAEDPDLVAVPEVTGQSLADAQATLTSAGFQPLPVRTDASGAANTVVAQTPEAGTRAQRGSSVVLFYVAP